VRVTDHEGHETEAFHAALGRISVLGAGTMATTSFYQNYRVLKENRDGERRVTRERRKVENAGRRHRGAGRRRLDAITARERAAMCLGIEYVEISLVGIT
jgi:hypothetical protein